jgi:imidazolonepropionase-like amidohydrolase
MVNINPILVALSLGLPWLSAFGQAPTSAFVIREVRVFDGERVLEHRNVLVEDGKIRRVGGPETPAANAEIIDGRGRTLLPGLFDAHLHLPAHPDAALHQLASLGITTVLDMSGGGEELQRMKAIESADPPDLADARAAGYIAIAPDSVFVKMSHEPLATISRPEEAESWMAARLAEGSDFIKIVYDPRLGGALGQDTVRAIMQAAHARGKIVVVHALSEEKARGAIAAGADGLAHLFVGDAAASDFGQFAAQHQVFVVPTLTILHGLCGRPIGPALLADPLLEPYIPADARQSPMTPADPSRYHLCRATDEAMQELAKAHIPILAGTDTSDATQPMMGVGAYGATLHEELKLLVGEGLTPVQALTAATSAPTKAFHLTDRGWIRPGLRADLLLVEGNPTQDILATRHIVAVWKRGVRVHQP